ncbi:phosphoribosyltransferase [Microlunatus speluncae]|uniref:phosphoribosyltransferase n=1 Tax=Microlunatus speluncae TaxID=2594267 RepID=UPI00126686D9|nr:phosphoribosyltransferase family protein [Microlunatus speluncae]
MNAQPSPGVVPLTWQRLEEMVDHLAQSIGRDTPQTLVAVLRGGAVPAVLLAHRLGLRDLRTIEVTHTANDGRHAAKTPTPVVVNAESLGDLAGHDVVIVDDVAGTGHTLAAVVDLVVRAGATRARTALCVVNADNWTRPAPVEEAATYIGEVTRGWVVFPWEEGP